MTPTLTDPLTSLPHRRRLEQRLDALFDDYAPRTIGLLVIDVDRFQALNEELGREAGDEALRTLGPRLRAAMAGEHLIVRLWSDEFGVLLERDATAERLAALAARVHRAFEEPLTLRGEEVLLRASIGGALLFTDDGIWPELMHEADLAARRARRHGSGYELYRDSSDDAGRELLLRVHELRSGIPDGELVVHYQPQVEASGEVGCVEALVRWQHPDLGLLEPGEFLLVAEAADLAGSLTSTVLAQTLGQLAAWHRDGRDLTVAVNLAGPNVLDERLPDEVERLLEEHGVPARRLKLELTERAVAQDPRRALATLQRLRALGVLVSLDDFGVAASSLAVLRRLPLDELKVDRSFVARVPGDLRDVAIVRAAVWLAHDLGLRTVAEGVELPATAEALREIGCDALQGFLFSRPLPADELEAWLDAEADAGTPADSA
ncbi:bifunctional diguanylate cyclase/phosphodiesterase [Conexibacter stalactiti]|uniref:Bifunctional diguanylate cyclase/phosphodiesterase n=1 Tax=Conexibacter stalactiti TaxID=1940611 RepID=A0ABU4HZ01_9ACTN|nr:bifunctional diguanylate cyclase/phosphodiesterase [Conexibacter stalactiti]MDW5598563.1 bifunctional diguanylate cyclase/phosphodiesterase [Conexibacter stalactiti]MEC5039205.1 bifunctional diguanylate cyclase/phosphodiesterase [Conexibacter stalactiti]